MEIDFSGYSPIIRSILNGVYGALETLVNAIPFPQFLITLLGIVTNIIHVIVLVQKSLRNMSTNWILLQIAVFDITVMLSNIHDYIRRDAILFDVTKCTTPGTRNLLVFTIIQTSVVYALQRAATWLSFQLALIRTLSVLFATNKRYDILINPIFSIFPLLSSLIITSPLGILYYLHVDVAYGGVWEPPDYCTEFSNSFSLEYYKLALSDEFVRKNSILSFLYLFYDGITRIIPSILLVPLTVILVREVKRPSNANSKRSNRTSRLVTYIALSVIIVEIPLSIIYLIQLLQREETKLYNIGVYLATVIWAWLPVNSIIHCIICFILSCKYRQALFKLFAIRVKKSVGVAYVGTYNSQNSKKHQH